jgi:hypothetical protein
MFDISDPGNPEFICSGETDNYAGEFVLRNDYLYIADKTAGIFIMDKNGERAAPSYDTDGEAMGITIDNDLLYIADESRGIKILDITEPRYPFLVSSYDTPGHALRSELHGRYLFIANGVNGLIILDCDNPESLVYAGHYPGQGVNTTTVAVRGANAYINVSDSIHIIDLWPYDEL